MKRFTIPCDFGGKKHPFHVYVGEPHPKKHPLLNQSNWLSSERGGSIPQDVMDSFEKLFKISQENNVSFEDLCVYALGNAKDGKDNKAGAAGGAKPAASGGGAAGGAKPAGAKPPAGAAGARPAAAGAAASGAAATRPAATKPAGTANPTAPAANPAAPTAPAQQPAATAPAAANPAAAPAGTVPAAPVANPAAPTASAQQPVERPVPPTADPTMVGQPQTNNGEGGAPTG